MKRLLCLGFLAATPGLAACTEDEPPVTSSNSDSDPSSSTDDTLASDVT
ncbi:MAG: hypothetical protein IAG13_19240, partial [Deltaproteobacteria bacterium]|nr:hypothetical protein [Nannocystaceae bacterium]